MDRPTLMLKRIIRRLRGPLKAPTSTATCCTAMERFSRAVDAWCHYVNRHAFGSGKEYHDRLWADSLGRYDLNIRLECINNNFRTEHTVKHARK